jgi:uncharacterized protein (TIGR03118 family)
MAPASDLSVPPPANTEPEERMMKTARPLQKSLLAVAVAVAVAALSATADQSVAAPYVQINLVSDIAGLATLTDAELRNSWGVSETATSPFWISNQDANSATLYSVAGSTNVSKVNINPPAGFVSVPMTVGGPQGPTGQVSNSNTASFAVGQGGDGGSAHFIFANLNGTISAWDTGATAFIQATTAGAVYSGVAVNTAQTRIYAANDAGAGGINVFNSTFTPVNLGATAFVDPNLPAGLVPFNVQDINGKVYVTYAPMGRPNQTMAAVGAGVVDVYDENGVFLQRLITGGQLAAPWGIALAPSGFGAFSGDLLVGNFSFLDSEINAFDPTNGAFIGSIPIDVGSGNTPGGLWALSFGNGGSGGSPTTLYFTDGINGEQDGLFGAILPVPEPSTIVLLGAALAMLGVRARKRYQG